MYIHYAPSLQLMIFFTNDFIYIAVIYLFIYIFVLGISGLIHFNQFIIRLLILSSELFNLILIFWYLKPPVQTQQQMCHYHSIQTVSRAAVEGLHLLWQLREGDVPQKGVSQSSSEKKTCDQPEMINQSAVPNQSECIQLNGCDLVRLCKLMRYIRLIEQITVIQKSIWTHY